MFHLQAIHSRYKLFTEKSVAKFLLSYFVIMYLTLWSSYCLTWIVQIF